MAIFSDYQMEYLNSSQTTHFSPWSYDRHVPLGLFGAPFTPGIYHGRVAPVDLAATFASLLGDQSTLCLGREYLDPGHQRYFGCYLSKAGRRARARPRQNQAENHFFPGKQIDTVKPDMQVRVAGINLRNPIIAASGTFGYGIEFEEIVSLPRSGRPGHQGHLCRTNGRQPGAAAD